MAFIGYLPLSTPVFQNLSEIFVKSMNLTFVQCRFGVEMPGTWGVKSQL